MNLLEFLISTSFVVLFAILISCVWKSFKSKPTVDNKYNSVRTEYVDNNTTISVSQNPNVSNNESENIKVDINQDLESCETNDPHHLNTEIVKCERLQHINKSRPKRSNIRRSTRKSKIESNPIVFEPNFDNEMHLKEETDLKTSMFSLRIEEVTQPLSSATHKPLEEQQNSHQIQCDEKQLNEVTEGNSTSIITTKPIVRPFFDSHLIAELKRKQTQSLHFIE